MDSRPGSHYYLAAGLFCLSLAALAVGCTTERPAPSCPGDSDTIKAADQAYADAWKANAPEQVMATLTDNAVMVPSGIPPCMAPPRYADSGSPPTLQ